MGSTRSKIGTGLLCVALLMSATSAFAAESDDGFKVFWAQFIAAVGKGDLKTVAPMAKYPIYNDGPRQIGDFPVIWKNSFKPSQRTCLAKQKPVKDTDPQGGISYSAFCGPLIYVFGKDGDVWKLTDFGLND